SSTTQIVTSTFRFFASASAAATMILIDARSRYFFVGKSVANADGSTAIKLNATKSSLRMRRMLPIAFVVCQMKTVWKPRTQPGGLCDVPCLSQSGHHLIDSKGMAALSFAWRQYEAKIPNK